MMRGGGRHSNRLTGRTAMLLLVLLLLVLLHIHVVVVMVVVVHVNLPPLLNTHLQTAASP